MCHVVNKSKWKKEWKRYKWRIKHYRAWECFSKRFKWNNNLSINIFVCLLVKTVFFCVWYWVLPGILKTIIFHSNRLYKLILKMRAIFLSGLLQCKIVVDFRFDKIICIEWFFIIIPRSLWKNPHPHTHTHSHSLNKYYLNSRYFAIFSCIFAIDSFIWKFH